MNFLPILASVFYPPHGLPPSRLCLAMANSHKPANLGFWLSHQK